jgi:hypothetical protein
MFPIHGSIGILTCIHMRSVLVSINVFYKILKKKNKNK